MTENKMLNVRLSIEAHGIIEAYMTEHNLSFKTEALEKLLRIKTQVADPEETQKLKDRVKKLERNLKDQAKAVNEELMEGYEPIKT